MEIDAFVTDDWRVRPDLTLNIGVRWEYGAPITELKDRLVNLDVASGFTSVTTMLSRWESRAGINMLTPLPFPVGAKTAEWQPSPTRIKLPSRHLRPRQAAKTRRHAVSDGKLECPHRVGKQRDRRACHQPP